MVDLDADVTLAIDALPFEAALCDSERRVIAVNRRFAARVDAAPGTLAGVSACELFDPAGRLFFETIVASRLALSLPCEDVAMRLLPRAGPPIETYMSIGIQGNGPGRRYILCFHDHAERRHFERELIASRARLLDELDRAAIDGERRMRGLREIAHDLRSPLSGIQGMADFALREPFGPIGHAKYRGYLHDIRESAQALDALAVAAIGLGDPRAAPAIPLGPIDPRRAALRAIRFLRPIMRRRGQRIALRLARPRPWATGNEEALHRLLLNLLSNASKFTPEGGALGLSISAGSGAVELRVSDSGDGIPADIVARLGDAFLPTRHSADAAERGSGLGLAIASKLANAMGGDLSVESATPDGSTLRLTLAAAP